MSKMDKKGLISVEKNYVKYDYHFYSFRGVSFMEEIVIAIRVVTGPR